MPSRSSRPRVSIITVTYNAASTLPATLTSVQVQTYPHLEHILIDGGSTDGTVELIRASAHAIAQWVSEPDGGLYDAMNKGLARATGDYVLFLNAGDELDTPDTLDAIVAFAEQSRLEAGRLPDILYGQAALIDAHRRSLGLRSYKRLPEALAVQDMRLGMVVCHQALVVSRAIAPQYDTRYRIAADIAWTIAALDAAQYVVNTGLVHVKYLVGGTSARNRVRSWLERWHILRRRFGVLSALLAQVQILFDALFRPGR